MAKNNLIYRFRAVRKVDRNGAVKQTIIRESYKLDEFGKRIASTRKKVQKTVTNEEYETLVRSGLEMNEVTTVGFRLDTGFTALITRLRTQTDDMGDKVRLDAFARQWSSLTKKQKEEFFEMYRNTCTSMLISSDGIATNDYVIGASVSTYINIINNTFHSVYGMDSVYDFDEEEY